VGAIISLGGVKVALGEITAERIIEKFFRNFFLLNATLVVVLISKISIVFLLGLYATN
jgi:hypothetical protein